MEGAIVTYPLIDPVAIQFGPIAVHWYGIMYLLGFAAAWYLLQLRAMRRPDFAWARGRIDDLVFHGALGVIVGGRIGYLLFYQSGEWLADPLMVLRVWEGGMSFHGGLIGVIAALTWFAQRRGQHPLDVLDFVAPAVPIGLGAGRIGNFINGELWGRVTDVPWAMAFPGAGAQPRHPSQLYELGLEGIALFVALWWFSRKPRARMAVSGMFLLLYGTFRFVVEFVRMPDAHLGKVAFDWMTMGQLLSLPMLAGGLLLLALACRRRRAVAAT